MLTAGSMVSGYRIRRLLGSGGMGAVYLADDPTLPRLTALKVLSAEFSRDPDFRARFIREADTAAALDHPQIVSVYSRGQADDGQLWIAMQFVDGTDAEAALRAGTMAPQRAVHIITEVAKALDFAHAHAVVHRDIKPGNFLLSGPVGPAERVLLGDFGIARALDDAGLTATGSVMATVAYAAPEVLSNAPIDGRADIYSLGCTLFRLLTGQTPFPATNGAAGVMAGHLFSAPPRVTDAMPSLPAVLDDVIAIGMAKHPADRYPSATALAQAAAAALRDPTRSWPLPPVPSEEVSSYPRSDSPAPTWWRNGGPRTMAAFPPSAPPLPSGVRQSALPVSARTRRRRWALIGGALAAVVVIGAGVAVVAWPDNPAPAGAPAAGPGPGLGPAASPSAPVPATDIAGPQLRSILLSATEILTTHGNAVVLERDSSKMFNDVDTVDNPACLGAWAPAQQSAYAGTDYTGVAAQVLRALNRQAWQSGVTQAVIAFSSQDAATNLYGRQRGEWAACGGKSLTVTPPGGPAQTWDFAQPVTTSGVLTLAATLHGGTASCQHGILVRGNVIIDIRECLPSADTDVTALITGTAAKIPHQ